MTFKNYKKIFLIFTIGILYIVNASLTFANDSQTLSVTPPLFQISVLPGDIWQSSVKVVNGNAYPLTVYTEVVNFEATGEEGRGKFVPILDDEPGFGTLAHWIVMAEGPHTIQPEQSNEIPFFVEVPKDAPPGGHYAAVLVSTEPPSKKEGFAVQTSQAVTSLFFLRIEGDVIESGNIREFSTTKSFLQRPEAEFSLRFENKGNVHLQPRGNIVITNMWGTERGVIPVNYQTHFGNVLPESIRDFKFEWTSNFGIADIGRYKAIATLAYGQNGIKSASATTFFWVIPVKATLITLSVIALFITLIIWMIKAYVRRMLTLAGVTVSTKKRSREKETKPKLTTLILKQKNRYSKVSAPLRTGVLDLRDRLSKVDEFIDGIKTLISFVYVYRIFFASVVTLVLIFISVALYIGKATEEHQNYKVIIDQGDTTTTLDGHDIAPTNQ